LSARFSMEAPEASTDDEDEPNKIAERIARVEALVEKERVRTLCYAAAMSRRWGVPASHFYGMARGPRKWELGGRKYVYRSASENGGVRSLTEMCLNVIDACYETMGELVGPDKSWVEAKISMPTAFEHNNVLCVVKKQRA
jgi:hypothetical protein